MTTYTAIANTAIDADSPITTGLMTLMRDNPIAIAEGASGAPRNAEASLASELYATGSSGSFSGSGTATLTATVDTESYLENHFFLSNMVAVSGTGTPSATVAFSNNGGSSWTSEYALGQEKGFGTPFSFDGYIKISPKMGYAGQYGDIITGSIDEWTPAAKQSFEIGNGSDAGTTTGVNRIRVTVTGLTGTMASGTIYYKSFGKNNL